MKRLIVLCCILGLANTLRAAETSQVDYGQIVLPPTLSLVWQYETKTEGEVTYAVITGLRDEVSAYPSGEITVPTTVYDGASGYVVKAIADGAFRNQIGITSISIPITIQTIGTGVFTGCSVLGAITVDSANPWFASSDNALYDKDFLTLLTVPPTLERISIPKTVSTIASSSFASCIRMKDISFAGDAPNCEDGDAVFADCHADLKITVTKGNTTFGPLPGVWHLRPVSDSSAPAEEGTYTEKIGSITWTFKIENGVAILRKGELSVSGDVELPSELKGAPVTTICSGTLISIFPDPDKATGLTVPASVTNIDYYAFYSCSSLAFVDLSAAANLEHIGTEAFSGCSMLSTLEIPASCLTIDDGAFNGCNSLTDVILPGRMVSLGGSVFYNCSMLQSIAMPSNLTGIARNAFYGCSALKSITLPENLRTIAQYAFNGCASLKSITIPKTVTSLGAYSFNDCTSLTEATFAGGIPSGLKNSHLLDYVTNVNCPEALYDTYKNWLTENGYTCTVNNIGEPEAELKTDGTWYYHLVNGYAELWCTNGAGDHVCALVNPQTVGALNLPSTLGGYIVKSIATAALSNLRGITSVSIPATYESIGDSAFSNCTSLASVTIANGVRTIGKAPFRGTALATLNIPASVESLNGNPGAGASRILAFSVDANNADFAAAGGSLYNKTTTVLLACPALATALELPATLKAIAADAFAGCTRLTAVTARCDEPLADEDIYADTPLDLTTSAAAYELAWSNPQAKVWKKRPFKNTSVDSSGTEVDASGCEWSYTVVGPIATLGVNGATPVIPATTAGAVTVPSKLAGRPVTTIPESAFEGCSLVTKISIPAGITAIAANAFDGCTSLAEFDVAADNPSFSSKNRCLYSKDGKTLIRVPAALVFAASQTLTTAEYVQDLVEVGGAVVSTKRTYDKTTGTLAFAFTPSLSADRIFAGVESVANHCFTDCGLIPEGTAANGTLVTKENGKVIMTRKGLIILPFSTETQPTVSTTNEISATAGFYRKSACLYKTVRYYTTTAVTDVPLVIPASVTSVAPLAFEDAHFTSVTRAQLASGLLLARIGGTSDVYGPLTPGVSVSLDLSEFAGCSASGLPTGMKWIKATGELKGIPTKPSTFTVTFKEGRTVVDTIQIRVADYPTVSVAATRTNPLTGMSEPIAAGEKLSFYVGVSQSFVLTVSDDLAGTLNTLSVKGLPQGLKLVKTALRNEKRSVTNYLYAITGTPTKAQTSKTVTISVSNKYKWSGSHTFEIEILTLPAWVAGSYNGVRYDTSSNAYGAASATLSTVGKLSGKFLVPSDDLTSGKSFSFAAATLTAYDPDANTFLGEATMKVGRESYMLPFSLAKNEDGTGLLRMETPDGFAECVQNIWNRKDLAAPAYTKGAKIIRDGLTFKLAAKGVVTWSGKIEDDAGKLISVSGTSQLLNGKDLLLYVPAKRNLLGGICQLITLD